VSPRLPRPLLTAVLALSWTAWFGSGTAAITPASAAGSLASASLPRITFDASNGATILVHGTYPKVPSPCRQPVQPLLHARYQGVIEVGRDTDGSLFVIAELPFEEYVKGIAEVPRTWPMEALKAQAVAARTYALSHLNPSDPTAARLGYQLCATDQCQVYRGLAVSKGPYGGRWRTAVNQTSGQALLSGGRPANTMYFSTSNGQTHGNDEIFGGSPLPYLRPVAERDDGASPLSHWSSSVRLSDVGRFLAAAGVWPDGKAVRSVRESGSSITVSGKKSSSSSTFDILDFRAYLNSWAHCLDPARYPSGGLPQTVPSRWFSARTKGDSVVMDGRGWGHGVGMVQWGAEGKAARGLGYADILAAYYGGLTPQSYNEPKTIRIGVATGLKAVTIAPDGDVSMSGMTVRSGGPWRITGGKRLHVHPADPPPSYIGAGSLLGPRRVTHGETRRSTLTLPQTSVAELVLASGGEDVQVTRPTTLRAGSTTVTWTVPSIASGTYSLQAVVSDGTDIVRTKGVRVRVNGVPVATPTPDPAATLVPTDPPTSPPSPPSGLAAAPVSHHSDVALYLLIGTAVLAVAVAVLSMLYLRRKLTRRDVRPGDPWEGPPAP
jgi:SpoIID/LytB domain protein